MTLAFEETVTAIRTVANERKPWLVTEKVIEAVILAQRTSARPPGTRRRRS
jgi:hypothetical protein